MHKGKPKKIKKDVDIISMKIAKLMPDDKGANSSRLRGTCLDFADETLHQRMV